MGIIKIPAWAKQIIDGENGLRRLLERGVVAFESDRQPESLDSMSAQAGAAWAIRCLADPDVPGSKEFLAAILANRRVLSTSR